MSHRQRTIVEALARLPERPVAPREVRRSAFAIQVEVPVPFADGLPVDHFEFEWLCVDSVDPLAEETPDSIRERLQEMLSGKPDAEELSAGEAAMGHAHGVEPEGSEAWMFRHRRHTRPVPCLYEWKPGMHRIVPTTALPGMVLTLLPPRTRFAVRCRAHTWAGYSPMSPWTVMDTRSTVPRPPVAPRIVAIRGDSVDIAWDGGPDEAVGIDGWRLEALWVPPAVAEEATLLTDDPDPGLEVQARMQGGTEDESAQFQELAEAALRIDGPVASCEELMDSPQHRRRRQGQRRRLREKLRWDGMRRATGFSSSEGQSSSSSSSSSGSACESDDSNGDESASSGADMEEQQRPLRRRPRTREDDGRKRAAVAGSGAQAQPPHLEQEDWELPAPVDAGKTVESKRSTQSPNLSDESRSTSSTASTRSSQILARASIPDTLLDTMESLATREWKFMPEDKSAVVQPLRPSRRPSQQTDATSPRERVGAASADVGTGTGDSVAAASSLTDDGEPEEELLQEDKEQEGGESAIEPPTSTHGAVVMGPVSTRPVWLQAALHSDLVPDVWAWEENVEQRHAKAVRLYRRWRRRERIRQNYEARRQGEEAEEDLENVAASSSRRRLPVQWDPITRNDPLLDAVDVPQAMAQQPGEEDEEREAGNGGEKSVEGTGASQLLNSSVHSVGERQYGEPLEASLTFDEAKATRLQIACAVTATAHYVWETWQSTKQSWWVWAQEAVEAFASLEADPATVPQLMQDPKNWRYNAPQYPRSDDPADEVDGGVVLSAFARGHRRRVRRLARVQRRQEYAEERRERRAARAKRRAERYAEEQRKAWRLGLVAGEDRESLVQLEASIYRGVKGGEAGGDEEAIGEYPSSDSDSSEESDGTADVDVSGWFPFDWNLPGRCRAVTIRPVPPGWGVRLRLAPIRGGRRGPLSRASVLARLPTVPTACPQSFQTPLALVWRWTGPIAPQFPEGSAETEIGNMRGRAAFVPLHRSNISVKVEQLEPLWPFTSEIRGPAESPWPRRPWRVVVGWTSLPQDDDDGVFETDTMWQAQESEREGAQSAVARWQGPRARLDQSREESGRLIPLRPPGDELDERGTEHTWVFSDGAGDYSWRFDQMLALHRPDGLWILLQRLRPGRRARLCAVPFLDGQGTIRVRKNAFSTNSSTPLHLWNGAMLSPWVRTPSAPPDQPLPPEAWSWFAGSIQCQGKLPSANGSPIRCIQWQRRMIEPHTASMREVMDSPPNTSLWGLLRSASNEWEDTPGVAWWRVHRSSMEQAASHIVRGEPVPNEMSATVEAAGAKSPNPSERLEHWLGALLHWMRASRADTEDAFVSRVSELWALRRWMETDSTPHWSSLVYPRAKTDLNEESDDSNTRSDQTVVAVPEVWQSLPGSTPAEDVVRHLVRHIGQAISTIQSSEGENASEMEGRLPRRGLPMTWWMAGLRPNSCWELRWRVANKVGWSAWSSPSSPVQLHCVRPARPVPPTGWSPDPHRIQLVVALPHLFGQSVQHVRLWRQQVRHGGHPDDQPPGSAGSLYSDDASLREVTHSPWIAVDIPVSQFLPPGKRARNRVQQAYLASEHSVGPRMVLEDVSVDQLEHDPVLCPWLSWGVSLDPTVVPTALVDVKGVFPGSAHRFRVACATHAGWSPVSSPTDTIDVRAHRPFSPRAPSVRRVPANPPHAVWVGWLPTPNGGAIVQKYIVQQRRWHGYPDSLETDEYASDSGSDGDTLGIGDRLSADEKFRNRRRFLAKASSPSFAASETAANAAKSFPSEDTPDRSAQADPNLWMCPTARGRWGRWKVVARDVSVPRATREGAVVRGVCGFSRVRVTCPDAEAEGVRRKDVPYIDDGVDRGDGDWLLDPFFAFQASGCVPGGRYQYRVRAVNSVGPSEWSNASDVVHLDCSVCATPLHPWLRPAGEGAVEVTWVVPSGRGAVVDGYCLELRRVRGRGPVRRWVRGEAIVAEDDDAEGEAQLEEEGGEEVAMGSEPDGWVGPRLEWGIASASISPEVKAQPQDPFGWAVGIRGLGDPSLEWWPLQLWDRWRRLCWRVRDESLCRGTMGANGTDPDASDSESDMEEPSDRPATMARELDGLASYQFLRRRRRRQRERLARQDRHAMIGDSKPETGGEEEGGEGERGEDEEVDRPIGTAPQVHPEENVVEFVEVDPPARPTLYRYHGRWSIWGGTGAGAVRLGPYGFASAWWDARDTAVGHALPMEVLRGLEEQGVAPLEGPPRVDDWLVWQAIQERRKAAFAAPSLPGWCAACPTGNAHDPPFSSLRDMRQLPLSYMVDHVRLRGTTGMSGRLCRAVLNGLRPGGRWEARVWAYTRAGWSRPSGASNAARVAATVPGRPGTPLLTGKDSTWLAWRWPIPRSRGCRITSFEVRMRRVLGPADRDNPSDDEREDDVLPVSVSRRKQKWQRRMRGQTRSPDPSRDGLTAVLDMEDREEVEDEESLRAGGWRGAGRWVTVLQVSADAARSSSDVLGQVALSADVWGRSAVDLAAAARGLHVRGWGGVRIGSLKACGSYQIGVRAVSVAGKSAWSRASEPASTVPRVPEPPESISLVGQSDALITIRWSAPRANGYPVDRFEVQVADLQGARRVRRPPPGVVRPSTTASSAARGDESEGTPHIDPSDTAGLLDIPEMTQPPRFVLNPRPTEGEAVAEDFSEKDDVAAVERKGRRPSIIGTASAQSDDTPSGVEMQYPWKSVTTQARDLSYMVPDLRPASSYIFRVRAHSELGWSKFSRISDVFATLRR